MCEGTDVAVAVRLRVVINLSLLNLLFIGDHEISPTVPHQLLGRREPWAAASRQEACCYLGVLVALPLPSSCRSVPLSDTSLSRLRLEWSHSVPGGSSKEWLKGAQLSRPVPELKFRATPAPTSLFKKPPLDLLHPPYPSAPGMLTSCS